jgi:hypothetical protein
MVMAHKHCLQTHIHHEISECQRGTYPVDILAVSEPPCYQIQILIWIWTGRSNQKAIGWWASSGCAMYKFWGFFCCERRHNIIRLTLHQLWHTFMLKNPYSIEQWFMTHLWGKLCGFIHFHIKYVVFSLIFADTRFKCQSLLL